MTTFAKNSMLAKHTAAGFGLQSSFGVEASTGLHWLPFEGQIDYKLHANKQYPTQGDYNAAGDHLQYSAGAWYEGGVPWIFTPSTSAMTDLLKWIFDRDSYDRGRYASVYKYGVFPGGALFREASMDVMVREATFRFVKGRPVTVALGLIGRAPGAATPSVSMDTQSGPFLWSDVAATVSYGGETAAVDLDLEEAEIRIDNLVAGGEDGLRFDSSSYPALLENHGAARVTGSVTRDFVDDKITAAFLTRVTAPFSHTDEASLSFAIARGSTSITLSVNGVDWQDPGPDFQGNNDSKIMQSGVPFKALASDDGTTPAIDYSIS